MGFEQALLIGHVAANMLWLGSMLAAIWVALSPAEAGGEQCQAALALSIYRKLSVPGFVASFVFGIVRLVLLWDYLMVRTHFMHAKLLLAFVAIVAHHWLGARLRARQQGRSHSNRALWSVAVVFTLASFGALVLVEAKPF